MVSQFFETTNSKKYLLYFYCEYNISQKSLVNLTNPYPWNLKNNSYIEDNNQGKITIFLPS